MKRIILVCLILVFGSSLKAQQKLSKHAIGLSIKAAHLFPNYLSNNENWRGTFYPSGSISLSYNYRFSSAWQSNAGIGLHGFGLINKGIYDRYTFDFVTPQLFLGIQRIFPTQHSFDGFAKATFGANFVPLHPFTETTLNYKATITPAKALNPYLDVSIGITNQFKNKIGNARQKLTWETGVSFTYQPNPFGTVAFESQNSTSIAAPTGTSFGMYFKLYFPTGKSTVSAKRKKVAKMKKKKDRLKKRRSTVKTVRDL